VKVKEFYRYIKPIIWPRPELRKVEREALRQEFLEVEPNFEISYKHARKGKDDEIGESNQRDKRL